MSGFDQAISAVRAADGIVQWSKFTGMKWNRAVLVDSQGNLYCLSVDSLGLYVFSADPNGQERWRYRISTSTWNSGYGSDFVMDWDGFLYVFNGAMLYSFDYAGQLRWQREFGGYSDIWPLLCDGDNVIYGLAHSEPMSQGQIKGFAQDGTVKFEMTLDRYGTTIGAIGENNTLYFTSVEALVPPNPTPRYKALYAVK